MSIPGDGGEPNENSALIIENKVQGVAELVDMMESPVADDDGAAETVDYVALVEDDDDDPMRQREEGADDGGRRFRLWDRYNALLERHPLAVKGVTAFWILGGGDLVGQLVEHVRGSTAIAGVDWLRTLRFAAFGLFGAPWAHYYFHYLDEFFPPTPEPFTRTTALKVGIDQFVQAPLLLALMISALSILKGEGFDGVKMDMSKNYLDSLIANCE